MWRIDLGRELYVFKIEIVSRTDCCFYLQPTFKVYLGKENEISAYCKTYNTLNDKSRRLLLCEPSRPTSQLTIRPEGSNDTVTLCEVFVYASGKCVVLNTFLE